MKWSLATSLGLHVAILAAALIVLPNPHHDVPPVEAIQVDISQIGDVTKKMAMAKDAEKPVEKPAPKKTEKVEKADPKAKIAEEKKTAAKEAVAEPPPPEPKKEEPKKVEAPKKEEPKPLDPDPLKALIKDTVDETPPKKEPEKKAETKKAEVKKPQKKPEKKPEKKKPKFDPDQIAALLNKTEDDNASPAESSLDNGSPAKGETNLQGTDDQLVGTIVDALVSKVKQCWTVPPGAREADMSIRIHFELNRDGTLAGTPQIESQDSSPLFDATARSAVAALIECQAYELPADSYDLWKANTLDFNPNLLFQG
jgi:colicin import membrane protein